MKISNVKSDVPFSARVYEAVKLIPCGRVSSYGAVAVMAGSPNAARAVGNILHKNPYFGQVPCHRVVHSDGRLAGGFVFGGPGEQKRMLMEEGIAFNGECVLFGEEGLYFEETIYSKAKE